jgi:hypothetical protein
MLLNIRASAAYELKVECSPILMVELPSGPDHRVEAAGPAD